LFALSTTALGRCAAALVGLALILALAPSAVLAELAIGGAATVASGEPVALRSGPGFDQAATTEVATGTQVTVADGPITAADGSLWYQVDVWGQLGFVPAYALGDAGTAAPVDAAAGGEWADPAAATTTTGWVDPATGQWVDPSATTATDTQEAWTEPAAPAAPVGTAWIAGTDGDGAVCRSGADWAAGELGVLPEGSTVEVAGDQTGEWTPVNCSGTVGYVNSSFVSWEQPVPVAEPAVDPWTGEALAEPALEAPAAEPVAETEPVLEPDLGVSNEPRRRQRGNDGAAPAAPTGSGQAMADFAMQFVGYPYAYAGAGPYAFDCSGFTMYVAQNVLGMDITHDMFTQVGMGTPVGFDQLQPGDLVFFQDTFRPGLSHAGIYIGGGQFVHAENESTGVKVSDIHSDYYSSRFYGATRLA